MKPRKAEPAKYVYFLRCGDFVKIGTSSNPRMRLQALASSVPHDVELLLMIDGGRSIERGLHHKFEAAHHRAEWYRLTEEIISFIAQRAYRCLSHAADCSISLGARQKAQTRKFKTDPAQMVAHLEKLKILAMAQRLERDNKKAESRKHELRNHNP